ncbi:MAG: choice-of-anchor V domain-containing protein [Bacteroidia bacterium]
MKNNLYLFGSIALLIGLSINIALSDSNGKLGNSGAPGESTCSQSHCHGAGNGNGSTGGLADNMGPGSIVLSCSNMPTGTYSAGTTYNMTVTITEAGKSLFGFDAVAVDNGMSNAGTIALTDPTHTRKGTPLNSGSMYITHQSAPAGQPTTTNPANFSFDWTPTANVGPVTFYFDGIAANNDQKENAGDNVYKGSMVINPATAIAAPYVSTSLVNATLRATTTAPGTVRAFFVAGLALTGNLTVSAPSPFELSTNPTSGFSTTAINLSPTSGNVNANKIYVRYNPTLPGSATATLTVASTGATSKTATLTGQTATPNIGNPSVSTIPTFTTTVGTPSAIDSFVITVNNLIDTVFVNASANFEISHKPTISFNPWDYANPFPPIWAFTNVKYYVRYNPIAAGSHTGTVTISSTGGVSKVVNVSGISTAPTGIFENNFSSQSVKVYPNPVKNSAAITLNLENKENLAISLVNLSGQKVKDIACKSFAEGTHTFSFDCSDVPQGLYFVSIQGSRLKIMKKLIIE